MKKAGRIFGKISAAVRLLGRFLIELMLSNLAVLRVVLRPRLKIRPGIIEYKTNLTTDLAKTWLANMITLTPGTLTLFISDDGKRLYIHTLDIDDEAKIAAGIRDAFETKLLLLEA